MCRFLRPRLSTLLLLLTALIVGAVSSQIRIMIYNRNAAANLAENSGLVHEDDQTMFLSPFSPNNVREMLIDIDHNGKVEQRTILIPMQNSLTAWYSVKDLDEDGQPDEAMARFDERDAWLALKDFDRDSKADAWAVVLSSLDDPKSFYTYNDFDMDGRLDRMTVRVEGKVVESYILLGDRWGIIAGGDKANPLKKVFLDDEAVGQGWFVFENGKWSPSKESEPPPVPSSLEDSEATTVPDESDVLTELGAAPLKSPEPNGPENQE